VRAGKLALVAVFVVGALAAAGVAAWRALAPDEPGPPAARADAPVADYPGGHPIDASFITTGKVAFGRMPAEVTGALELHSAEILKQAAALEAKQARVSGTCAPGSAIRVVAEDGSVVCQHLPRGVVSVAAITAIPRRSSTPTEQGAVPGGVGRYQSAGEDDWLVAPVPLPDGAIVTGFAYVFWDADPAVDGAAYLYRTDDVAVAAVRTAGAAQEVRIVETDQVHNRKVDATAFGYFVYFQVSAKAGKNLLPIAALVSYRLP
jgi:hypothetical protein